MSSIPANITQNTDPGLPTGVVTWSEPTASDNSGSVTLTSSHESGEAFPIGVTVVTYTAVDAASNMVSSSFAVLIEGMTILFIFWCDILRISKNKEIYLPFEELCFYHYTGEGANRGGGTYKEEMRNGLSKTKNSSHRQIWAENSFSKKKSLLLVGLAG